MMGLGKKFAVTFSFIMGIPAVLGAVILEIPEVVENGLTLPLHIVIIGFVTSLVFGLLAIALVNRLVSATSSVTSPIIPSSPAPLW